MFQAPLYCLIYHQRPAAFVSTTLMSISGKFCNNFIFEAKSFSNICCRNSLKQDDFLRVLISPFRLIQLHITNIIIAQQTSTRNLNRFSSANTESQIRQTSGNGNSCDNISVSQRKL